MRNTRTALINALLLIAGGLSLPAASAQMGPMTGMTGIGMESMGPRAKPRAPTCQYAQDKAKCEANRQARQEHRKQADQQCLGVIGRDHRRCVRDLMVAQEDCATAQRPERCTAMKTAHEACKEKMGPEMRQCMRDKMRSADARK